MEKLLNTEMTITEIAHDLGLSDTKNITRIFKQVQGLSPLEYRKKIQHQKIDNLIPARYFNWPGIWNSLV